MVLPWMAKMLLVMNIALREYPAFAKHLRTWGEAGTVKIKTKTTPKLADRGVQCMMVGYALDHDGDCYRMWNPETNSVYETRDVVWMKWMYYQKPVSNNEQIVEPTYIWILTPLMQSLKSGRVMRM